MDVNQDGNLDVVIATSEGGISRVDAFFGNGDGTFRTAVTLGILGSNPSAANQVLAVDVNNDGKVDLVTSSNASNLQPRFLLGNGDGTFRAAQTIHITSAEGKFTINAADLNGDGSVDLVFNGSTILFGNGNGTFQKSTLVTTGGYPFIGLNGTGGADFNNDGIADIAVSSINERYGGAGDYTMIFLGNGDGTFSFAASVANRQSYEGSQMTVADFDGDGNDDLLRPAYDSNSIEIFYGNGDGSFTTGISYSHPGMIGPVNVVAGDLNGDGVLDVATGAYTRSGIGLSNTTTQKISMAQRRWHIDDVDLPSSIGARQAIAKIDKREQFVHLYQGVLGAAMSRIGHAISNLQTQREGAESARSRIVDADIAVESSAAVRTTILQQTGAAVLAQANNQPQLAFSLLKG